MFRRVVKILSMHHFHHQMWCFVVGLFDKSVIRNVVLQNAQEIGLDNEEKIPLQTRSSSGLYEYTSSTESGASDEDSDASANS